MGTKPSARKYHESRKELEGRRASADSALHESEARGLNEPSIRPSLVGCQDMGGQAPDFLRRHP